MGEWTCEERGRRQVSHAAPGLDKAILNQEERTEKRLYRRKEISAQFQN